MKANIKTAWDLSPLYKSPDDQQIEKDLKKAETAYTVFVKKYSKDSSYLKNDEALLEALKHDEKLSDLKGFNSYMYLSRMRDLDSRQENVKSKSNLAVQRLQKMSNSALFFGINLAKVPMPIQKKFLSSPKLKNYKYFLKKLFENNKYILSDKEEKIISLKYLPSHKLWVDFLSDLHSKQTVKHEGKEIPISKAGNLMRELKTQKERVALYDKTNEKAREIAHIAESELNAIVLDKKIDDELRGYKKPYDATLRGYENEEATVLNLVKTVTDSFPLVHKFYKIKAKMLGLKKLKYADRFASVGKTNKKIIFNEGYKILYQLFTDLDPEFGKILERFAVSGQIDVFPKVGKRGGAYCDGGYKVPTYIFLNYADNFDSLSTFAHEMGHGIHTELSKVQPLIYQNYSTSTAEVASTLFENFLFHDQFKKMTDKEKVIALHDKISDAVGTIFTQIALFNFEVEMHETIREKGRMTKEDLARCMLRNLKACYGNIFDFEEKNGYAFVTWPHIRYFFYVYTYAMGLLTSNALYKKYSEDKSYMLKIKKFMELGGSMSPEDIFKSIGVDVRKPDFFKKGIESIEDDIKELEKLVEKSSKKR